MVRKRKEDRKRHKTLQSSPCPHFLADCTSCISHCLALASVNIYAAGSFKWFFVRALPLDFTEWLFVGLRGPFVGVAGFCMAFGRYFAV